MLKVTFAVLNLCNTLTQEIEPIACFMYYSVFNWKVHVACDLNFDVKGEGLLEVTGSHVY